MYNSTVTGVEYEIFAPQKPGSPVIAIGMDKLLYCVATDFRLPFVSDSSWVTFRGIGSGYVLLP